MSTLNVKIDKSILNSTKKLERKKSETCTGLGQSTHFGSKDSIMSMKISGTGLIRDRRSIDYQEDYAIPKINQELEDERMLDNMIKTRYDRVMNQTKKIMISEDNLRVHPLIDPLQEMTFQTIQP